MGDCPSSRIARIYLRFGGWKAPDVVAPASPPASGDHIFRQ